MFIYGVWGGIYTSEDVHAQNAALGLFLLWCVCSLALTAATTIVCARRTARRGGELPTNKLGLVMALLCLPVLVFLRIKHLQTQLFPIPAGIELAMFVCFWSLFCSVTAWGTARRFALQRVDGTPGGASTLACSEPLLITLIRGRRPRIWALRIGFLVITYVLLSGPALLASFTPIRPAIVAVYTPMQQLCMMGDRNGALLSVDIVMEYWCVWCKPQMNPINPRPML
jgi:hypothetical protein